VNFASPSKRPQRCGSPSRLIRGRSREPDMDSILSWGSLSARPSTDIPFARPLPRAEALFGPTAPPVSAHVPPSWFRTTSTASSARRLQVCCTLLPVLGFAAFRHAFFRPSRGRPGDPTRFPATQARTLRRLPLASSRTASPRSLVFTAGRCPLAVTSRPLRRPRPSRRCRACSEEPVDSRLRRPPAEAGGWRRSPPRWLAKRPVQCLGTKL